MARKRKDSRRMAKVDRQNRKLWAEGCRESILEPHIAPYTDALERGWQHERTYLATVFNHYHALIPWRLPDYEEPPLPLHGRKLLFGVEAGIVRQLYQSLRIGPLPASLIGVALLEG